MFLHCHTESWLPKATFWVSFQVPFVGLVIMRLFPKGQHHITLNGTVKSKIYIIMTNGKLV